MDRHPARHPDHPGVDLGLGIGLARRARRSAQPEALRGNRGRSPPLFRLGSCRAPGARSGRAARLDPLARAWRPGGRHRRAAPRIRQGPAGPAGAHQHLDRSGDRQCPRSGADQPGGGPLPPRPPRQPAGAGRRPLDRRLDRRVHAPFLLVRPVALVAAARQMDARPALEPPAGGQRQSPPSDGLLDRDSARHAVADRRLDLLPHVHRPARRRDPARAGWPRPGGGPGQSALCPSSRPG